MLEQKVKTLKEKLKRVESEIEKLSLEIDLYRLLLEKAQAEENVEEILKYKKLYLKAQLDYIEKVEAGDSVKFLTLKNFLKKEIKEAERVQSGIMAIDKHMGGIPVGVMIQFAAASYAGKTTTMMRIALNIARKEKVAHFNYEMSELILHRLYSKMAINVTEQQLNNLIIPEDISADLEDLVRTIKILAYKEGVRFFIIDSRMKITAPAANNKELASKISKTLSELVIKLGVTIILINQLSEEAIKENRIILKESGDQKYDADIVLGLGFVYEADEKGKPKRDEMGRLIPRKDVRLLVCDKDRLGEPWIDKIYLDEIFPPQAQQTEAEVVLENFEESLPF